MRVITFDGDGTLWDFERVMRYALSKISEVIKNRYPNINVSVEDMIKDRDRVARERKDLSLIEIRRLSFYETLGRLNIKDGDFAEYLFKLYIKFRHEKIILFDDVIPVLEELKKSYRIGLITNGNTRFHEHPIRDYLDFAIQSEDVGISKPAPEIFKLAADMAKSHDIVHVGDSIEEDYLGAIEAGFDAVWLNRKGLPRPEFVKKEIKSLYELVDQKAIL